MGIFIEVFKKSLAAMGAALALVVTISAGGYAVFVSDGAPFPGSEEEPFTYLFNGKVALTLDVPQAVHLGEPVPLKVSVENVSGEALTVFYSYPTFSFSVSTPGGEPVWSWVAGRAFPKPLRIAELRPGDIWEFEYVWEQHTSDCDGPPTGTHCKGNRSCPVST